MSVRCAHTGGTTRAGNRAGRDSLAQNARPVKTRERAFFVRKGKDVDKRIAKAKFILVLVALAVVALVLFAWPLVVWIKASLGKTLLIFLAIVTLAVVLAFAKVIALIGWHMFWTGWTSWKKSFSVGQSWHGRRDFKKPKPASRPMPPGEAGNKPAKASQPRRHRLQME